MYTEKIAIKDIDAFQNLCYEHYLVLEENGEEVTIDFELIESSVEDDARWSISKDLILKVADKEIYYRVCFSYPKGEMGCFSDVNYSPYEIHRVYPKTITKTIYTDKEE